MISMGWFTDWKRKRVLTKHRIDDALWRAATRGLGCVQTLSENETRRLQELVLLFLAEKEFSGAAGLRVSDAMRLSIAARLAASPSACGHTGSPGESRSPP